MSLGWLIPILLNGETVRPLWLTCSHYITYNKYCCCTKCRNSDENFWMHQFHRGKQQISEKVPSSRSIFIHQSTCTNYTNSASSETSSRPLAWIAQPMGIFVSSAQTATKLQLQPYNAFGSPTPWCRVQNETNFVNWYLQGVYVGENAYICSLDFLTLSITGDGLHKTTL